MNAPNDQLTAVPDSALLQAVQHFNQARIVAKLLHDLRNPVHSLRIAVELFGRIAKEGSAAGALLEKAGRYAAPAEGAAAALAVQVERLARYLSPPRAATIESVAIDAWLAEMAVLLRESTHKIEASVHSEATDDVVALADAPRVSHGVLYWALSRAGACALHAAVEGDTVRLRLESRSAPRADGPASDADIQRLIVHGGGVCEMTETSLTIILKRCAAPT